MRAAGAVDLRQGPYPNLATIPIPNSATDANANNHAWWSVIWQYWGTESTQSIVAPGGDGPTLPGISGALGYARKTITAATHPSGNGIFILGVNPDSATAPVGSGPTVTAGTTYSLSLWVRSSIASYSVFFTYAFYDATGAKVGFSIDGTTRTTTTPNVWVRNQQTVTIPATAVTLAARTSTHGNSSVGSTFDATALMVTTTPAPVRFADGDSAGWRWLGTSGASQSVGYTVLP